MHRYLLPSQSGDTARRGRTRRVQEKGTPTSLLEAADALGISTVASASLLQGRLAQKPPAFVAESLPGLETDAQRAIQFTRSAPGLGVALVGMSRVSHAEENLRLAAIPPAPIESYKKLFESER